MFFSLVVCLELLLLFQTLAPCVTCVCVYVFRVYFRTHSALPLAWRLFQRPYRRSGGVSRHGLFTLPQGTNQTDRQSDRHLAYEDIFCHFNSSFSLSKVKIHNSKVYVSVNKKVSKLTFLFHLMSWCILSLHIIVNLLCSVWK